jgi:hypothetical protein
MYSIPAPGRGDALHLYLNIPVGIERSDRHRHIVNTTHFHHSRVLRASKTGVVQTYAAAPKALQVFDIRAIYLTTWRLASGTSNSISIYMLLVRPSSSLSLPKPYCLSLSGQRGQSTSRSPEVQSANFYTLCDQREQQNKWTDQQMKCICKLSSYCDIDDQQAEQRNWTRTAAVAAAASHIKLWSVAIATVNRQ